MHSRLIVFLMSAVVVTALIAGCGGGSSSDRFSNPGETQWTVMVFINADNDLEPFSVTNINQMERIGSSGNVKVVVQWDRAPGYSTADGNWTGTRRYEITKDGTNNSISSKMIEDMGEIDMGDPQVMKDFISWAQLAYPAQKYCLVIWNHGSGWRSVNPHTCSVTRNISFDDTSGTSIRTADLPDILTSVAKPIDLVAMDASLMQMVEVAYELKGTTNLLVGSEESPPGDGYVYDKWLGPLSINPGMSALTLGRTITDTYVQAYDGSFAVTESVIDLSKMPQVASALDSFATALIPYSASHAGQLRDARENSQHYSYDDYQYKDLLDYAQRASQAVGTSGLSSAYTSLANAVGQAVVYEAHSGTSVANSHGLSIWVPDPATYQLYRTRYSVLGLSEDTVWDDFLAAQEQ